VAYRDRPVLRLAESAKGLGHSFSKSAVTLQSAFQHGSYAVLGCGPPERGPNEVKVCEEPSERLQRGPRYEMVLPREGGPIRRRRSDAPRVSTKPSKSGSGRERFTIRIRSAVAIKVIGTQTIPSARQAPNQMAEGALCLHRLEQPDPDLGMSPVVFSHEVSACRRQALNSLLTPRTQPRILRG